MLKLFFGFFLFGFISSTGQTTILVDRSKKDIFIATDSRRVYVSGAGIKRFDSVCKIRNYNNVFVTGSGINLEPMYGLALTLIKQETLMAKIVAQFRILGKQKFQWFMDSSRRYNVNFDKYFKNGMGLSLTFCGFENNVSKVIQILFEVQINEQISVKEVTHYYTSPVTESYQKLIMMGHFQNIMEKMGKSRKILEGKNKTDSYKSLIQIEIDADPDVVGKPINILQIYQGGYKWIENPVPCGF